MRFRCYEKFIDLSSVLSSGPVPDFPLKVGLGVSLDEGVDGALLLGENWGQGARMWECLSCQMDDLPLSKL